MAFTNKPFIWKNNGVTPPETLQNSGFIGGKKLPAPYVNAQWTATYKAIEEIQQKAGEVKTVNNVQPDGNGNVLIPLPDVSKFYQKPPTGIPKTDLSTDVQASLVKAESALQSVPLATAALDGLMAKSDKVSLDNVMSVFANLQKMKITNDDGSAVYTIGATLPTVKKGIFYATATTGTYAPPASSVEGIIIAESASYWNFIGASDNGTWCVGTFQGSWKGWTTLATAKDVFNLSTRITALETSDTTHQADLVSHGIYGVATGTNALVMTDSKVTSYVDGMLVAFKNTTASTASTTLNINSLGAKAIVKANGTAVNNLKANAIYQLRYNGTNFILLGEGGEYGNVTASDVLSGKIFGTENGLDTGTLTIANLNAVKYATGIVTEKSTTGEITIKNLSFQPKFYFANVEVLTLDAGFNSNVSMCFIASATDVLMLDKDKATGYNSMVTTYSNASSSKVDMFKDTNLFFSSGFVLKHSLINSNNTFKIKWQAWG